MVWAQDRGKSEYPCVPAGSRRGALTAAKPGSTALTFLHSGQAQSLNVNYVPIWDHVRMSYKNVASARKRLDVSR